VKFGDLFSTPVIASDTQMTVALPNNLTPGVKTLQVIQNIDLDSPTGTVTHKGFESNILPFVLAPTITTPPTIQVTRGANLTLDFQPSISPEQKVLFLIGDYEIPLAQRDPTSNPVNQLSALVPTTIQSGMKTAAFPTGTFLLRMRVDGAESPLQVDS